MHKNIENLERIKKINKLIKNQQTGNSNDFALKLNICRRQLFNIIEYLRAIGAPIKYNKKMETFYYDNDFNLEIKYSVKIITNEKVKNIYGGEVFYDYLLKCNDIALKKIKLELPNT
ncbi:MAG: hypothetical protein IPH62_19205 [Ignavibacteriae bacterium]|nr:hypothetical protein [Ignavibacteriota bacterium]